MPNGPKQVLRKTIFIETAYLVLCTCSPRWLLMTWHNIRDASEQNWTKQDEKETWRTIRVTSELKSSSPNVCVPHRQSTRNIGTSVRLQSITCHSDAMFTIFFFAGCQIHLDESQLSQISSFKLAKDLQVYRGCTAMKLWSVLLPYLLSSPPLSGSNAFQSFLGASCHSDGLNDRRQ